MVYSLALAIFGFLAALSNVSDVEKLAGTWQITALIEDGNLVADKVLKTKFAVDGRLTVSGQTIRFIVPSTLQERSLLFVLDQEANPKTIDLAGAEKNNGKGIYVLSEDVLMLCLGEPSAKERPKEFEAKKGTPYLLMTLKRVKPTEVKAQPVAPAGPPALTDQQLRDKLVGTWGHQDDEWVSLFTLNTDGTFSSIHTFKNKFGKLFHPDVRSSGDWKVKDGTVISTVTASTDKERMNQVSSFRLRSLSATDLICVDQFGRVRREWKTR